MGWDSADGPAQAHGTKGYPTAQQASDAIEASHVRDRVCTTEQLLSTIHAQIDSLEQRLDTVLTPNGPDVNKRQDLPPTPPRSHLVGRLEVLNDGYSAAVERLVRLRNRIEV